MSVPPADPTPSSKAFSLLGFFGVSALTAAAVPPFVFVVCALLAGMGVDGALDATVAQYRVDRLNLLMLGVLGVIPFALLTAALLAFRRFGAKEPVAAMAVGGWTIVTLLLLWAHGSYWPSFLPDRVAPMWPHGIEFVIVPLFFAPVGAAVGMVVGGLVHRFGASK